MNLSKASVLLTGASGGLGSAIARRLHAEGSRLLLVGRSADALVALANTLSIDPHDRASVDILAVDITTGHGRAAVIDAAQARCVDVLINNAAVPAFGAAEQISPERAQLVVETNILAPMLLTGALVPELRSMPEAAILNIGSILGSLGVPGFSVYGASKAALRVYTEALRRELADTRLRVQYYAPRAIDTPFNSAEVRSFNAATGSATDTPDVVAQCVVRLLKKGEAQRYAGAFEALAVRLNALFPRLLDSAFAKHRRALDAVRQPNGVSS
ncbi:MULTISPECIES: SDR family oxidoreductase [unclassified Achromobacter]|uniref:SDR family oxidoreductase n=1 Tax=unclassified Achromobacter TaxID=2626865 RepID=UPI000B514BBE|nr:MULTISPECIES: SDR family oxidoreductase [unclassified Achromobacter]OWT74686.1 short chain dehydrogenase [Achromobacter sp. HZ34]OWT79153.1 short chain dehydrogenase [Achromobacter sp. HZ28]